MSNPLNLKSGDISRTSPAITKSQELAKRMILDTVAVGLGADEALAAVCGVVTWIISHFPKPEDQAAAVTGFVSAVQTSCTGNLTLPLSSLVQVGKLKK